MNAKHDLAEALCQLLETKTLEKIAVKDIVARCGVNRQTFYYHFHDVYDLMRWIFDREAAALARASAATAATGGRSCAPSRTCCAASVTW